MKLPISEKTYKTYQSFLNAIPIPALITDAEGLILTFNDGCTFYKNKGIALTIGSHIQTYIDTKEASTFLHFKNRDSSQINEPKLLGLQLHEGKSFYVLFNMQKLQIDPSSNNYIITLTAVNEHLSSENLIRTERDFYKNLLDNLPADIAVFDPQFRYIYVNRNAIKDDVTRSWLIGRTDIEYCIHRNLPLEIGQERQSRLYKLRDGGEEYSFEEKISRNNTDEFHLRIMRPIYNQRNHLTNIIGYGINITAQKISELKNQEQALAIESSHDGIAILDADQTYRYINSSHAALFGYSDRNELIGKSWTIFYEEEELNKIIAEMTPALIINKKWRGETQAKKKSGELIHVDISVTLMDNNSMLCLVRDITKRKEKEDQLKRLAVVASQTNSLVIFTNQNHEIEWMNDSFLQFSEFRTHELINKKIELLFDHNCIDCDIEKYKISLTQNTLFTGELRISKKNGKQRWLHINSTPISNKKGEIINFVIVANDITLTRETKENYRQLLEKEKELHKLKSQFVNLASHEFRTPLANILSSVDLLELLNKNQRLDSEKLEKHLSNIASDIERMSNIMVNIFDVGKAEAIKSNFNPEVGNITNFIKDIATAIEMKIDTHKIIITENGEQKQVLFDKNLIDHAITNLISNAIKYSPQENNITIDFNYKQEAVEINVIDYGVGIPVKDQQNLFSSFYRGSNVNGIKGTGLGLVIVKQFIEQHNGTVEIFSKENEGCKVKITLPLNS